MSAHVKMHNGTPTLFLDGQPAFAGYLWTHVPELDGHPAAPTIRRYAEAGVHLYAFDVGTQSSREWRGPGPDYEGHFNFSETEARLQRLLDIDPETRFHFRVHLDHRGETWWHDMYPEECELCSDGERIYASFASTIWRSQAHDFLRAFIGHIDRIGLTDRVVAYQTGAGGTGEWVKGVGSMAAQCADFSAPMAHHFRDWVRNRYADNEDALRTAWADDKVRFDTAVVPSAAAQLNTTHLTFRDPRIEQAVIDYYRYLADLCADLLIDFHRTVKEATNGQALAGAFYGYLLELAWNMGFFGGEEGS